MDSVRSIYSAYAIAWSDSKRVSFQTKKFNDTLLKCEEE